MTTQGKFTMTGLTDYMEALARAAENVDVAAQEVLLEAGTDVQNEMRSLVPFDSGNLFEHIQLDGPFQDGNYSYVEVGVIRDLGHTDRETAIYGNVIEYGSAHVTAQPYIRPALDRKKSAVKTWLKRVLARYGVQP